VETLGYYRTLTGGHACQPDTTNNFWLPEVSEVPDVATWLLPALVLFLTFRANGVCALVVLLSGGVSVWFRYASVQPAGVDPRALVPGCPCHCLVTRRAALRHALWRHSIWTRRTDHEGWGPFTSTRLTRSVSNLVVFRCIEVLNWILKNKEFVSFSHLTLLFG